ncbi:uncharacterized protein LOC143559441 [Bidens hawaiensis]|uniref:uncharacterized protein LOC143559441 n=1 Tax=Bidens hawaiensis TaxID=980011 RepID=UPI00404A209B
MLIENPRLANKAINSDGSTGLHVAVGIGYNLIVRSFLFQTNDEQVLTKRHSDGSTALHVAAIVGNTPAAKLLVKKNRTLLLIKDNNGKEPLYKAYENMHLGTMVYFLESIKEYSLSADPLNESALVDFIVNAISARQYGLALGYLRKFPNSASSSDEVLMAIAKNFPSGLDDWEEFI